MIKNIVFDMGNVLILDDAWYNVNLETELEEDRICLMNAVFRSLEWVSLDRGAITEEKAIEQMCRNLPMHLHLVAEKLVRNWHADVPPFQEMENLVRTLKERGYHLYLLSNTSKKFYQFRKNIPALDAFDGTFISADWNLLKPSKEIFMAFFHHFQLIPTECYFVDDTAANVDSGKQFGMDGFVFHGDVETLKWDMERKGIIYK